MPSIVKEESANDDINWDKILADSSEEEPSAIWALEIARRTRSGSRQHSRCLSATRGHNERRPRRGTTIQIGRRKRRQPSLLPRHPMAPAPLSKSGLLPRRSCAPASSTISAAVGLGRVLLDIRVSQPVSGLSGAWRGAPCDIGVAEWSACSASRREVAQGGGGDVSFAAQA